MSSHSRESTIMHYTDAQQVLETELEVVKTKYP